MADAGLTLASRSGLFSQAGEHSPVLKNIKSKGYAAKDTSDKLSLWKFERRPVGDNDILIDVKFASICHSDIHQLKGDWGRHQYPQVPGHEIAGIVAAVGRNVTKFEVENKIFLQIQITKAADENDAWDKVTDKKARYRFVIDAATI
ncbi:alcohol dehydrogenase catalytic domain-containing protein [Dyadobacter flavalbus]|uniref:Alcohol dehydrogenase catalytic domain-containing protein n=2 Tax=Dyadobacter flavalbus TaxID=2579942 RepID=A0A5M8QXH2_9BACT|nr:alcohol dehydrogenase catalytic domain-containing protein [Dyadobacter flavalbus]